MPSLAVLRLHRPRRRLDRIVLVESHLKSSRVALIQNTRHDTGGIVKIIQQSISGIVK